jgi:hypothetical protein
MTQLLVRVDDDVAQAVRRLVREQYGGRRGALSLLVEEALRQLVTPPVELSAATLLEVIDYVARASKENRPKDEILTNVFIMLDREFEQSLIRGMDDVRRRRVRRVPAGEEPIEFLRRIAGAAR